MHSGRQELGRFATGLPPGAFLSADAFLSQQVFGSHGTTANPALSTGGVSDLETQVFGKRPLDTVLPVLDVSGHGTFYGGAFPVVTKSGIRNWVSGTVPFVSMMNSANSADARRIDIRYDAGGIWAVKYSNDAFGASADAISVTGTSAAIGAVAINGTTLALSGAITAALGIKCTGGTQPGVTVSATNSVVVGGFPYRHLIDAAQTANNRLIDQVWAAGTLQHRFVNDAYGASTPYMSVTGGHGTGVSLIQWPNSTNNVVGHSASITVANAGRFQVMGTSDALAQSQISRFSADTGGALLAFSKSRSGTTGTNTIVVSGDVLGQITAYGADGTNYDPAAQIIFESDGTPGAGTDMPGRIRVLTSPDGTATLTEALRVNNQQEMLVGVITRNTSGGKLQAKAGGQTTNNANVGGTTYYNVTQTGNGALSETDAFSHSVAAATLATNGDTLEFEASGTITASASVDKRIKVVFGSTTLFDTGALAITGATDWTLSGTIIRTGAATQKAKVAMNTSAAALMAYCDYTAPAETLANALTLKLTVNATLANDVIAEFYKEKWMPGA